MAAGTTHLCEAQEHFVALWGRMGSTWGIPRTMAQVHALLFIKGQPLHAEEVMTDLGISRGNASMTLRRLVEWGLVRRDLRKGDRKEYFTAEQDIWKLFRTILDQRKKREVDPLLDALQACRPSDDPARRSDEAAEVAAHNERIDELIAFVQIVDEIASRFLAPSGEGLEQAAKLLERAS